MDPKHPLAWWSRLWGPAQTPAYVMICQICEQRNVKQMCSFFKFAWLKEEEEHQQQEKWRNSSPAGNLCPLCSDLLISSAGSQRQESGNQLDHVKSVFSLKHHKKSQTNNKKTPLIFHKARHNLNGVAWVCLIQDIQQSCSNISALSFITVLPPRGQTLRSELRSQAWS